MKVYPRCSGVNNGINPSGGQFVNFFIILFVNWLSVPIYNILFSIQKQPAYSCLLGKTRSGVFALEFASLCVPSTRLVWFVNPFPPPLYSTTKGFY